jgi:hypothetical protein
MQCRILVKYVTSCLSVCVSRINNFRIKCFKYITALLNNVRRVGGLILS